MMLTILGLPPTTKYKDLKVLIKTRCNLNDFILDDLVSDNNGTKKVRIGLADTNEGSHLIKCLDGYRMAGCTLSVVPVGKSQIPQQNFGPGGNFNQPPNNYQQNDYNDRPLPWGQQSMPQNEQMTSPQWIPNPIGQGAPNQFGFQQQGPPMQNNQFIPPQQHQMQNQYQNQNNQPGTFAPHQYNQSMAPQGPHPNQNNQGPHGSMQQPDMKYPAREFARGPQDQGFATSSNVQDVPARRNLRSVQVVDTPIDRPVLEPNRYPAQPGYQAQGKPMTITKDNFQGPSQYSAGQAGPAGPPQQPWGQQQQQKPSFNKPQDPYEKRFEKPPFDKPVVKPQEPERSYKTYEYRGRDKSPLTRSPVRGMRHSPGRMSPRRHSPGRRSPDRHAPPLRRPSPVRRPSPGRRSSPGRREPLRDDRRSPGRMGSTMEAASRPTWHARRVSPVRRSPERKAAPGGGRYSPTNVLDQRDDFMDHGKAIRPAYEPTAQAPNQAMYSGGYRPNVNEKGPYPGPGPRPDEPRGSWQQDRDKAMRPDMLKRDEDRNAPRMPFDRAGPRIEKDLKRSHSPRKSRSPVRRDKSPSRDRFKRHSPSPRSPRRSWALEKRRSPEDLAAPPPPIWPGQAARDEKRPDFVAEEPKRTPVWEYNKKALDDRRPEAERRFPPQDPIRVRTDLGPRPERREDLDFKRDDRFGRDGPKFSPREDFDSKGPKFSPRDDFDKKPKFSPRDDFDKKPKFSPRDDFDKKPKFSPRDDFDKKPKFSPRDDFDMKHKFSPRDDFDKKPKLNPRDDFEDKRPKFAPFEDNRPKFEPRQEFTKPPKFSPRDTYEEPSFNRDDMMRKDQKYGRDFDRPKFSPRDDFTDRHDDFRRHDVEERKPWNAPSKPVDRDEYRRDVSPKRPELSRMELHRDVFKKMSEHLDKEFEEVHKRAVEFQKRAEEFRRDDRRREYEGRREVPKFEDRPKYREDDRRELRYERKEDWNTEEYTKKQAIKARKTKAVEEISQKILDKHNIDSEAEHNKRMCVELNLAVSKVIDQMFGDTDVPFVELIIKFNAKYSGAGEDKILRDVMACFPSSFKPKRSAPDYSEGPSKRRSPEPDVNQGFSQNPAHNWDMTQMPYGMYAPMVPPMMVGPPMMVPGVPGPVYPTFQEPVPAASNDNHNLYLCKDDFEPFMGREAELLRKFLVDQIVKESETSQGWAPDFTFKGLQSNCRYELATRDDASKDWLLNCDFSSFKFNILVYTSEELWYERAAIWLPGHSRCRIEPLNKLKLQNKSLEGANVGKWKLVKKIVTAKGTRVYVDMPPSAARALEKHKMTLSYELQKVNVFLKAVAIDKLAFDLGLKDKSITDETELKNAAMNTPMPCLSQDHKIVKVCLPGNKQLNIMQARKIRETLIYHLFKYHQKGGTSKTDFVKHGFINPGYFGVLPENEESRKWLMNLDNWKAKNQSLMMVGADESSTKYITMTIYLPDDDNRINPAMVIARLKHSNKGVKGMNFGKWKTRKLVKDYHNKSMMLKYEADIDIESVEAIIKMDYKLDYVDERHPTQVVEVKYNKPEKHLLDLIKKCKAELHDTYDDADMDLGSSGSGDEEDVICLDND